MKRIKYLNHLALYPNCDYYIITRKLGMMHFDSFRNAYDALCNIHEKYCNSIWIHNPNACNIRPDIIEDNITCFSYTSLAKKRNIEFSEDRLEIYFERFNLEYPDGSGCQVAFTFDYGFMFSEDLKLYLPGQQIRSSYIEQDSDIIANYIGTDGYDRKIFYSRDELFRYKRGYINNDTNICYRILGSTDTVPMSTIISIK